MNTRLTVAEVREQLGYDVACDLVSLKAENERLRAELAALKAPKKRAKKGSKKITMRDVQGAGGPFTAFAGLDKDQWQRRGYLEATGKATVPAHDPRFGRL